MRAFIMCAGEAERWEGYLGVAKQLAPVDGEPLLHRTIRELAQRGVTDVYVVSRNPALETPAARFFAPARCRWLVESIASTAHLWQDQNVFLLGDVWFSSKALDSIVEEQRDLAFFGRPDASRLTGCAYRELFALRVSRNAASDARHWLTTCIHLAQLAPTKHGLRAALSRAGALTRLYIETRRRLHFELAAKQLIWLFSPLPPRFLRRLAVRSSVWSLARLMMGRKGRNIHILGRLWSFYRLYTGQALLSQKLTIDNEIFVAIDDWTEDFDFPRDYDNWRARHDHHLKVAR